MSLKINGVHPNLFPAEKLRAYPHMRPADVLIWERFLEAHRGEFDSFAYDVAVGSPYTPPEDWSNSQKIAAIWLSKKKIDVVGFQGKKRFIIEVKPSAMSSAIGQALCYLELYKVAFGKDLELIPAIVTDVRGPDFEFLCKMLGVLILFP